MSDTAENPILAMALPPLREDLELIQSGSSDDGAPLYTIHDPLTGRFFRIGWMEFEFLSRWHVGTVGNMIAELQKSPALQMPIGEIFGLIQFLKNQQLVTADTVEDTERLLAAHKAKQHGWFNWLLHNYLYLRVPLIKPDQLLVSMLRVLNPLFGRVGLFALLGLIAFAANIVFQHWGEWRAEFAVLKSPEGLALAFLTLTFSKIIHEFGHGLMARHFGCRVPRMGVAIILLWPVLWTDTTQAWRLKNSRHKLLIDSAGILFELGVAAIATILWVILPDGTLRSAMHILSGVAWIMTLTMNASPFMRFDGYYILSDILDMPNLQTRSFALTRWWLRKHLLGASETVPELFPPERQRLLIGYAICCWLYRLVLFTGIALMVYHHFFKALGILLFIIEIWWFILKPVTNELRVWGKTLQKMEQITMRARLTFMAFGLLLLLFALPIHRDIQAPGLLRSQTEYLVQSPVESRIAALKVRNGQEVRKGDIMVALDSPDLRIALERTGDEITSLRAQISALAAADSTFRRSQLLQDLLTKKVHEQKALQSVIDNLTIKAPADGVVRDLENHVADGLWLQKREPLFIVATHASRIDAFVTEEQLSRLKTGQPASIIDGNSRLQFHGFEVQNIELSPVTQLPYEELASTNQGPIRVRQDSNAPNGIIPADQLFRVMLTPSSKDDKLILDRSGPVILRIEGDYYSPLLSLSKRLIGILIRESNL